MPAAPQLQAFWNLPGLMYFALHRIARAADGGAAGNFDCSVGNDLGQADAQSSVSYDVFPLEELTFLRSNLEWSSNKSC